MKIVLYIFFIIFISGCATKPIIKPYTILPQDKVGYIIKTNKNMLHTHIGTTVFNNYVQKYPKLVTSSDIESLLKNNFNANLVKIDSISYNDLKNLISNKNHKWIINNKELYQKLITDLRLKAVLLIKEKPVYISLGTQGFNTDSSGLFSYSFMGLDMYFVVSGFDYSLYLLSPVGINTVKIKQYKIVYHSFGKKNKNILKIKDLKHLSQDELNTIKKVILEINKNNIIKLNTILSNH